MLEKLPSAASHNETSAALSQNASGDREGWHLLALSIQPGERAAVEQMLQEHGVSVEERSDYSLYIRDPEGNRIALSHWPQRPAAQP